MCALWCLRSHNDTVWISGFDWLSSLELLSLDFIDPVFSDLGVGVSRVETLRGIVRDTLRGRLHDRELNRAGSPEQIASFYSVHVPAMLGVVERALDTDASASLGYWVSYVACTEDDNPWCSYQNMFESWASVLRRTGIDRIEFSGNPRMILSNFETMTCVEESRQKLISQKRRPLTEWDFPLFRERGLLDLPDGSDFFPFIDQAALVIAMNAFQNFGRWLKASLSEQDFLQIDAAMQARGAKPEVHPWDLSVRAIGGGENQPFG